MAELARLTEPPPTASRDLRALPWSSIDNDDSRDLDQIEVCIEGAVAALLDRDRGRRRAGSPGVRARCPRPNEHDVRLHAGAGLSDAAA